MTASNAVSSASEGIPPQFGSFGIEMAFRVEKIRIHQTTE